MVDITKMLCLKLQKINIRKNVCVFNVPYHVWPLKPYFILWQSHEIDFLFIVQDQMSAIIHFFHIEF